MHYLLLIFLLFFSYEERARSLGTVITKHKDSTTYEEFIARVYSPVATRTSCTSGSSNAGSGDAATCASNQSMLAAALLDSHGHSHHKGGHHRGEQKFRGKEIVIYYGADFKHKYICCMTNIKPLLILILYINVGVSGLALCQAKVTIDHYIIMFVLYCSNK